ncbi:HTH-type transcriptional regulator Lrp [Halococcus salsus]|uniref:HTH-type transcriptional regulator Lrp n=1 Tax=Halococcus salsus TaxID=2162894 RepID=UPI00135A74FA|nr:HTH-type transcriptional regulator Lrp [Halococcus salsus]
MAYENLDTDLINELLGNGRASLRSLAETLDVSVTTVSNHLQDLEETGVIRGYSPTVDYDTLGYDVTAIMQLTVDGSVLSDVTESLREHHQILSVYEVTGGFDVIAIGKFRDTEDMNDQIKSLLNDSGINESNTSVVLNTVSEYEQFELDTDTSLSE